MKKNNRSGCFSIILHLIVMLVFAGKNDVSAKSPPLNLVHADFNENTVTNGKIVSFLKGNVVFEYDSAIIKAESAKWFRHDGMVRFQNNVKVDHGLQTLECDYLDFDKKNKVANVRGHIDFKDNKQQSRITADHGVYHLDSKHLVLDKKPAFFRYDTTNTDTMKVVGKWMAYNDTSQMATVIDSVSIIKGNLTAKCQTVYYFLKTDEARLRKNPFVFYDTHDIKGDSIDVKFVENRLHTANVMGNALGIHRDYGSKDTITTRIDGDSLFLLAKKGGKLDSMWVYGNTKSKYWLADDTLSANEASGRMMLLAFDGDGKADNLKITGNASSTYYIEDSSGKGRNISSGDKIWVKFDNGKAAYIKMTGSVRGIYFANADKK